MKKLSILSLAIVSIALVLSSCGKDKEEETVKPIVYNVEQNKSNMEADGIKMMNEMDALSNSEAVNVAAHLANMMEQNDPFQTSEKTIHNLGAFKILNALKIFSQKRDADVLFSSLKSISEEPSTIQEAFDGIKGLYTWNASTNQWMKSENTSFILEFPASSSATSNNASFTLTYLAHNGVSPFVNYQGDLPGTITAVLKANNSNLLTYNFNATYDVHGYPLSVTSGLDVMMFKFSFTSNRSDSKLSFNYSLKNGTKTLLNAGVEAIGNFTYDNINKLSNGETQIESPEELTKLATSLSVNFRIMRYKLEGSLNIKGLSDAITAAGGSEDMDMAVAVGIINKNYKLGLYDVENQNALVANTEFYVSKSTHEYTSWEWSEEQQQYVEVLKQEEREDMLMRFVFPDNSKGDMETYFESGFDKLEQRFESFITNMENKFSTDVPVKK